MRIPDSRLRSGECRGARDFLLSVVLCFLFFLVSLLSRVLPFPVVLFCLFWVAVCFRLDLQLYVP